MTDEMSPTLDRARSDGDIRRDLRAKLAQGGLVRMPGAASPLTARQIAAHGFDGIYVSGAGLAADLGLPDIGLADGGEFAHRAGLIARAVDLPTIADADTGFGGAASVARTVRRYEEAGVAGLHLEDQPLAKRCGQTHSVETVAASEMVARLRAALDARRDEAFVIIARSDARTREGFDATLDRLKAYRDAGADALFPNALQGIGEIERAVRALDRPILINCNEFGRVPPPTASQLANAGVAMAIWPLTLLRLQLAASARGLEALAAGAIPDGLRAEMASPAALAALIEEQNWHRREADAGE